MIFLDQKEATKKFNKVGLSRIKRDGKTTTRREIKEDIKEAVKIGTTKNILRNERTVYITTPGRNNNNYNITYEII